jgi:hypothetical protein
MLLITSYSGLALALSSNLSSIPHEVYKKSLPPEVFSSSFSLSIDKLSYCALVPSTPDLVSTTSLTMTSCTSPILQQLQQTDTASDIPRNIPNHFKMDCEISSFVDSLPSNLDLHLEAHESLLKIKADLNNNIFHPMFSRFVTNGGTPHEIRQAILASDFLNDLRVDSGYQKTRLQIYFPSLVISSSSFVAGSGSR